jgi:threonylcarbamoyladenosine tRNA methylthiotransferase CDKAL1
VGFPSESDEDFQRTLDLIEETKPDIVNASRFSPRPGTLASRFSRINSSVVTRRTNELHKIIRAISRERNEIWRQWKGNIIIDEVHDTFIQGRNYAYKPVFLAPIPSLQDMERNWILGSMLKVRIDDISNFSLKGSILS